MQVEFVSYQIAAAPPTCPSRLGVLKEFPDAARCPAITATFSSGLWVYPPFDADIEVSEHGEFLVKVHQVLESLLWMERMEQLVNWGSTWWCSKIPGVFQIDVGSIFVTEPNEKLIITQPINEHDRNYFTQTGLVDSDCFFAPFTINLRPAKGISQFSIRRDRPIAHLLSRRDILAEMSFKLSTIEERPSLLKYWREYIDVVFGLDNNRVSDAKRIRSVYRKWTSSIQNQNDVPKPE